MTSTPVSLKDGSLEGSWVDIRCATFTSQQTNNENSSPETPDHCRSSPYCMIGNNTTDRVSFQVQRFLQESQRATDINNINLASSSSQVNISQLNNINNNVNEDSQSLVYLSDSDNVSQDGFDSKALFESLKAHNTSNSMNVHLMENNINHYHNPETITTTTTNDLQQFNNNKQQTNNPPSIGQQQQQKSASRNVDYIPDQLSDSLSLLSRASGGVIAGESDFQELDWLWDWTAQPEYFTGQEWKVYAPKQEYLMRQRQLYRNGEVGSFGADMASLLVLTNVLSIIIGAGLTYGILARKNGV